MRAARPRVQLGRHGDRVGGLAARVQVEDRVVDALVCGTVEVAGTQDLQHVGDRVLAQQHSAQYRLLGGHVLRGLAAEVLARRGRGGIRVRRMPEIVDYRHARSTVLSPSSEPIRRIGASNPCSTIELRQTSAAIALRQSAGTRLAELKQPFPRVQIGLCTALGRLCGNAWTAVCRCCGQPGDKPCDVRHFPWQRGHAEGCGVVDFSTVGVSPDLPVGRVE